MVAVIGWRPLPLLPDMGEKDGDDEEEDSSPTGDETGKRRGFLSWLWEGDMTLACPWRAGEREDILRRLSRKEKESVFRSFAIPSRLREV